MSSTVPVQNLNRKSLASVNLYTTVPPNNIKFFKPYQHSSFDNPYFKYHSPYSQARINTPLQHGFK